MKPMLEEVEVATIEMRGAARDVRQRAHAAVLSGMRRQRFLRWLDVAGKALLPLGALGAAALLLTGEGEAGGAVFIGTIALSLGLFVVKALVAAPLGDVRRPHLVRALLTFLDVDDDAEVRLRLDLSSGMKRSKRVRKEAGTKDYVDAWLELEVPVNGATVHVRRTEHVRDTVIHSHRKTTWRTETAGFDELGLALSGRPSPLPSPVPEWKAPVSTGKSVAVMEKAATDGSARTVLFSRADWDIGVRPAERLLDLPQLYLDTLEAMARELPESSGVRIAKPPAG